MSQELETIQVRHHNIGDHNVWSEALAAGDGLAAVAGSFGEITPARDNLAQTLPRGFLIVHYEHTLIGHIESLAQRSNMKRIQAGEVRGLLIQQFRNRSGPQYYCTHRANCRPSTIAR